MVVDGTGLPRRRVDVGVTGGSVAKLGHLQAATSDVEIDATGQIVSPGIVDIHTHYDPQITFDPYAAMSSNHGVTTVVAGNCGFSVAPTKDADRGFIEGVFAAVENMDPIALSGVTWKEFETFPEFMASREGRLGVNFACYVGHSNLRQWVLGEDATKRTATADEVDAMAELLREALAGGAAGLSSSASPTHLDTAGRPVPSRLADESELLALAAELGRHGAGSLAFLPKSSVGGLDDADKDLLIRLAQGQRAASGDSGAGRPQQGRRAHGDLGGVEGVPGSGDRAGRGHLLHAHHAPVRPGFRRRRDEPALPCRPELESDAQPAGRRTPDTPA